MRAVIKTIYLIIQDDNCLICESNLSAMYRRLPNEIKEKKSYHYFVRAFKKQDKFEFEKLNFQIIKFNESDNKNKKCN